MASPEKRDKVANGDSSAGPDYGEGLTKAESQHSGTHVAEGVFNNDQAEVSFSGLSWPAVAVIIVKLQIGLGVLNLPDTFHVLGFFPGIFCFLILAAISSVAGYLCGNARQYFPQMHSVGDATELLFGNKARDVIGIFYCIYLAMIAGAGMLATSVSLNALSEHGACTMVFVAVTLAVTFIIGTAFRSLEKVAWISWVGAGSIIVAIWVTAIACLAQSRPAAAPATGHLDLDIRAFANPSFSDAMTAIANQLFAVGGTGTFFSVSAEMKEPKKFTRSLVIGQSIIVVTDIVIASIVYGKVGKYLASPALGSAGPLIKKVAYGLALPGLLVTAVLWSHIAAKYSFVRILRGTRHLQSNTVKHWAVWIGSMLVITLFGFVIVGVVPFFGDFLSLVGALVNPIFVNVIPGFMLLFFIAKNPVKVIDGMPPPSEGNGVRSDRHWFFDALQAYKQGWKNALALIFGLFMVLSGFFIIVGGTYSTVRSIKSSYDEGTVGGVFSCSDNSV